MNRYLDRLVAWGTAKVAKWERIRLGRDNQTYDPMPEDRLHPCHATNPAGTPTEWITYEPAHGFELYGTNAYGGGEQSHINYCPWCGEHLMKPEHELLLSKGGRLNRNGIVTKGNNG